MRRASSLKQPTVFHQPNISSTRFRMRWLTINRALYTPKKGLAFTVTAVALVKQLVARRRRRR